MAASCSALSKEQSSDTRPHKAIYTRGLINMRNTIIKISILSSSAVVALTFAGSTAFAQSEPVPVPLTLDPGAQKLPPRISAATTTAVAS